MDEWKKKYPGWMLITKRFFYILLAFVIILLGFVVTFSVLAAYGKFQNNTDCGNTTLNVDPNICNCEKTVCTECPAQVCECNPPACSFPDSIEININNRT